MPGVGHGYVGGKAEMEFLEKNALPDPVQQFLTWQEQAQVAGEPQTSYIALASAGKDGRPSVRFVILRSVDERGFVFYTNYDSRKAGEMEENPWASFALHWPLCERQVRVEGPIERIAPAESDAYYLTRPRESRLEAWASPQSRVIDGRPWLEARWGEYDAKFADAIPRPEWWGGYRLIPELVEFWQQQPHRMHDRLQYRRRDFEAWVVERLAP